VVVFYQDKMHTFPNCQIEEDNIRVLKDKPCFLLAKISLSAGKPTKPSKASRLAFFTYYVSLEGLQMGL